MECGTVERMRSILLVLLTTSLLAAQSSNWPALEFLMGDWTGTGSGSPGQGSGSFSFKEDLQGKVVVRKNRAEYPATKDRPAYAHDDLMIVYRETPQAPEHAIYFDNEGHVIRYDFHASKDGRQIVFESTAEPEAPRYRLTYTRVDQAQLGIKFEVAAPGGAFKTYIEAAAHRAGS